MMKEELRAAVAERLGVEMESVRVNEVMKNNGKVMTALVVMDGGKSRMYPNVYIDKEMEDWRVGRMSLDELVDDVVERYKAVTDQGLPAVPKVSREMILNGAIIQVVNAEKNAELLKQVPNVRFCDLAAIVRAEIDLGDQTGEMVVTNQMIAGFDIDRDQLLKNAAENTKKNSGFECLDLRKLLMELAGMGGKEPAGDPEMWVATNRRRLNGASVLMFPDILSGFADLLGGDMFVLPSSIHEVMLVPVAGGAEKEELSQMVREINAQHVIPEEVLSDTVYIFNRRERTLRIA